MDYKKTTRIKLKKRRKRLDFWRNRGIIELLAAIVAVSKQEYIMKVIVAIEQPEPEEPIRIGEYGTFMLP